MFEKFVIISIALLPHLLALYHSLYPYSPFYILTRQLYFVDFCFLDWDGQFPFIGNKMNA